MDKLLEMIDRRAPESLVVIGLLLEVAPSEAERTWVRAGPLADWLGEATDSDISELRRQLGEYSDLEIALRDTDFGDLPSIPAAALISELRRRE